MPILKTYDLFISHAWKYGSEYERLTEFLNNTNNFSYRNYSAPKDKPLDFNGDKPNKTLIKEKLENKIKPVNVVLIVAGMYYHYKEWIQFEIETAKKYNKPIIVIKPWGQTNIPTELQNVGVVVVGWNTSTIIEAIRKYSI